MVLLTQSCIPRRFFSAGAFGIIKGDGCFDKYVGSHSSRPIDLSIPTTADSLFDVASVTKSVVGLMTLWAVSEGLLSLDDAVHKFLPDITIVGGLPPTVRDLMSYAVRLHLDFLKKPYTGNPGFFYGPTLRCAHMTAGSTLHYGNYQPILLALILEKLTGKTFADLVSEVLFVPIGMSGATFDPPKSLERVVATEVEGDIASGSLLCGTVHDEFTRASGLPGASGLFATCRDLLCLLRFILDKGAHEGKQIIREDLIDLIGENQFASGPKFGLGFGIWDEFAAGYDSMSETMADIDPRYSEGAVFKNGFTGCQVCLFPRLDTGVVTLTNHVHPKRRNNSQWINRFRYASVMTLLSGSFPKDTRLLWDEE